MKQIGEYILRDLDFKNRASEMGFSEEESDGMLEEASKLVKSPRLVQIIEKDDWGPELRMLAYTTLTDEEIQEGMFLDEDEVEYVDNTMDYEEKILAFAEQKNAFFERIYAEDLTV